MKRPMALFGAVVFLVWGLCAVETVTLTKKVDLGRIFDENEIFFRTAFNFTVDGKFMYIADRDQAVIHKVDMARWKTVKVISRKGQGPGELGEPIDIYLKKGKLYVLDKQWSGIKVFDTNGRALHEFRVTFRVCGVADNIPAFFVNDREELFLASPVTPGDKLITVYDGRNGKVLRRMISKPVSFKYDKEYFLNSFIIMCEDREGNILVLHRLRYLLRKYTSEGKLLWEKTLADPMLERAKKDRGGEVLEVHGNRAKIRPMVSGFTVTEANTIIIEYQCLHGCLLDRDGNLLKLIEKIGPGVNLMVCGGLLYTMGHPPFGAVFDISALK